MTLFPLPPAHQDPRQWPEMTVYAATVLLEAEGEPQEGQLAVAWVIRNRMDVHGDGAAAVCLKPWQFSCWIDDYAASRRARLTGIDAGRWALAWRAACAAYWRFLPDPTRGAVLYLNPELCRRTRPGGTLPAWYDARRVTLTVGAHEFLVA